ncbi:MAG: ribonuclease E/G [Pseudomonadota bacterium]
MQILIDELNEGLWVAAIQKDSFKRRRLVGLEIDPYEEEIRSGSVYWARVIRIDKNLDAALVQLDEDNTGILHNKDFYKLDKNGAYIRDGNTAIGKNLKEGDMLAVQAKSGYLPKIDGTDLTMEDKSARVSMNITLPGRYIIYAPLMGSNRISKRIKDKKQRKQLTKMLNNVETLQGCILRAAAMNTQTDVLMREGEILKHIWEELQEYLGGEEPFLVMDGPDSIRRTLSDQASVQISRIDVSTLDQYKEVEEWCEIYAPDLVTKIHPAELPKGMSGQESDLALFDFHDILDQVDDLFDPYVLMNGGGNIIIQETAALTAIDINRSSDTRSNLAINLDALTEIGRQIRLRNLGGIIMIDFLKMTKKAEKEKLLAAFDDVINADPCTVQVHGYTPLGLIELTRQRRTPPLQERLDLALD